MSGSSAPPSSGCAPSTLLLQRRLCAGDSRKWRTMLRLTPAQMRLAEELISIAGRIDSCVIWRVTTARGELLASRGGNPV